ncbi:MAG TPA: lamin tail domain-containing protein [Polyangia bacterium]
MVLVACLLLGGAGCSGGEGSTVPEAKLFINELQPSNQDTIADEMGEADDWIEIINTGDSQVDMLGFSFADSSGTIQTIPSSVSVAPGAFHLFWADDSPSQGASHLGFKLGGKAGDSVTLKDRDGRMLDTVSFGPTTGQNTRARFPDGTGTFVWCAAPTPGTSNGAACLAP